MWVARLEQSFTRIHNIIIEAMFRVSVTCIYLGIPASDATNAIGLLHVHVPLGIIN